MDSKVTVPAAKVLETLRKVVSERPDYMYEAPEHMTSEGSQLSCFYVHTDADGNNPTPGCVVGELLHRLGVPLETLALCEGQGAWTAVPAVLDITGHPNAVGEVIDVLTSVQDHQDHYSTWGVALKAATS